MIESSAITTDTPATPHKPGLDVDLNVLLPSIVEQLLLGKGRGRSFVSNKRSEIWHAQDENAKKMIQDILTENFYSSADLVDAKVQSHTAKVANWFHALMKKNAPWTTWTHDIYDAMRCIDHLPIR